MENTRKEKSITKNSLFYLLYNILNVIFPLVTGIYVAHVLLPGDIGEVDAAKNIAQYFVVFAFLGIPTYGLREIAKAKTNQNKLNKVYSELFIINAVSTFIFLTLYIIVILSTPAYSSHLALYLVTGISIVLNALNNSWLYEGLEEFKYISIRNLIFKIICFVLLFALVREQSDYYWYASITVFGTAGNYILNVIHSRKFVRFTIRGLSFKRHFKPIFYLVFVNLAIEIYSLVDVTMLKFLSDAENIAFYSYGSRIFKVVLQIINSFTIVVVPRLSSYFQEGRKNQFNELISKTLKIIILLSLPTIIGIFFISDSVITLVYGEEYYRASIVLKILSFNLFISPVSYLLGSRVLLATGGENKMVIPVASGAVVNTLLNYFLIIRFDEYGASLASVCGEIVVLLVYLVLSAKKYKLVKLGSFVLRVLIALFVMFIVLFKISSTNLNSIICIVVSVIIAPFFYFGTLSVLKEETVTNMVNKVLKFNKK